MASREGTLAVGTRREAPHLAFLVTEDWYFRSHRLPLAQAALEAGFRVSVLTREGAHAAEIRHAGLELHPVDFQRRAGRPLADVQTLGRVTALYRELRPDIVHHVALKPVFIGSLAARLAGLPRVVNALTGLGHLYTEHDLRTRLLRGALAPLLRPLLCGQGRVLVLQNGDDEARLREAGVLGHAARFAIIRGAGVDLARFSPSATPGGRKPLTIMLVARMLRQKGVPEFAEAARRLVGRGLRFVLVGPVDEGNPSSLDAGEIEGWVREGLLEWWGSRDDMPAVLAEADVLCLPSWREGLPKVLLEGAACGLPLVATDVPGCREVVEHGRTGLLVPPRDPPALADAIEALASQPAFRASLGRAARAHAEAHFGSPAIIDRTLAVYRSLLA